MANEKITELYDLMTLFSKKLIQEIEEWDQVEINFEIQPLVLGMSGYYLDKTGAKKSIKAKFDSVIKQQILQLHQITSGDKGQNKWNKMKFTLHSDGTRNITFLWDEQWQTEVDGYNKEAEDEDKNYKAPKWFWDE